MLLIQKSDWCLGVGILLDHHKTVMIGSLACFTLLFLAAGVDFVDGALPCTSPLSTRYPQLFWHCPKCSYTQWTTWSVVIPVVIRNETTCDSNKAKKYERTRTPLPGAVCNDTQQRNLTYKCKYGRKRGIKYRIYSCACSLLWFLIYIYLTGVPTLRQQAELFIRSLRFGTNADKSTDNSATTQTTQPQPQSPNYCLGRKMRFAITSPTGVPTIPPANSLCTIPPIFTNHTTYAPNITFNPVFPYRGLRDIPEDSAYCPSQEEQVNNRICPTVCLRGTYVRQWPVALMKVTVQSMKHLNYCEIFG